METTWLKSPYKTSTRATDSALLNTESSPSRKAVPWNRTALNLRRRPGAIIQTECCACTSNETAHAPFLLNHTGTLIKPHSDLTPSLGDVIHQWLRSWGSLSVEKIVTYFGNHYHHHYLFSMGLCGLLGDLPLVQPESLPTSHLRACKILLTDCSRHSAGEGGVGRWSEPVMVTRSGVLVGITEGMWPALDPGGGLPQEGQEIASSLPLPLKCAFLSPFPRWEPFSRT